MEWHDPIYDEKGQIFNQDGAPATFLDLMAKVAQRAQAEGMELEIADCPDNPAERMFRLRRKNNPDETAV